MRERESAVLHYTKQTADGDSMRAEKTLLCYHINVDEAFTETAAAYFLVWM